MYVQHLLKKGWNLTLFLEYLQHYNFIVFEKNIKQTFNSQKKNKQKKPHISIT